MNENITFTVGLDTDTSNKPKVTVNSKGNVLTVSPDEITYNDTLNTVNLTLVVAVVNHVGQGHGPDSAVAVAVEHQDLVAVVVVDVVVAQEPGVAVELVVHARALDVDVVAPTS